MSVSQKHPYHLIDPSPWLLLGSLGALASTIGGVMYKHSFVEGGTFFSLGSGMILYIMFVWWCDLISEFTYKGHPMFVV
jgi:cytochrome c oxidase subunit 3